MENNDTSLPDSDEILSNADDDADLSNTPSQKRCKLDNGNSGPSTSR